MTMQARNVTVDLGDRSYSIAIGQGLLERSDLLAPIVAGRSVAIVSNARVLSHRLSSPKGPRRASVVRETNESSVGQSLGLAK